MFYISSFIKIVYFLDEHHKYGDIAYEIHANMIYLYGLPSIMVTNIKSLLSRPYIT